LRIPAIGLPTEKWPLPPTVPAGEACLHLFLPESSQPDEEIITMSTFLLITWVVLLAAAYGIAIQLLKKFELY
jgi:hypothetical protein